jgi:hypothetical protein
MTATETMAMTMSRRLPVIEDQLGFHRQSSIGIIKAPRGAVAAHYEDFTDRTLRKFHARAGGN